MLPRLLRCLASLLVAVSLSLPFAAAQSDTTTIERGVSVDPTEARKNLSTNPAAVPHVVMALYTMLVLTIVFMPSRKA